MSMAEDVEGLYDDDIYDTDDSIFREYLQGNLRWTTKEGVKIPVSSMICLHIENCMKLPLYKNKENWDVIFKYELNLRERLTQK